MKGFRDAAGNALSLIAGSLIGVAAYYAYVLGGYQGRAAGAGVSSSAGGGPGGYYALAAG